MSFFDSEIVQEEMKEIQTLQNKVYSNVWTFADMNNKDKREHIDDLDAFLINLKEVIHKNSYIYIEVPDITDFITLKHEHFIFSEPSHLWYFSSDFLIPFFNSDGFKILSHEVIRTVRGRNDLRLLLMRS